MLAIAIVYAPESKAYLLVEESNGKTHYVLYSKVLLANATYLPLLDRLKEAKKGDVVRIIVRKNFGGAVPTMNMITNAIHKSKAKVIISVEGWAASAGAHILLQGDIAYIPAKAQVLWHTGSICYGPGKCVRLTPVMQPFYAYSVWNQRYLYPSNLLCVRPHACIDMRQIEINIPLPSRFGIYWKTIKINPPGDRKYISKDYWDFFLTGQDKWVFGREFCQWNLGDIALFRDKREQYLEDGCKLTGVKGQ